MQFTTPKEDVLALGRCRASSGPDMLSTNHSAFSTHFNKPLAPRATWPVEQKLFDVKVVCFFFLSFFLFLGGGGGTRPLCVNDDDAVRFDLEHYFTPRVLAIRYLVCHLFHLNGLSGQSHEVIHKTR